MSVKGAALQKDVPWRASTAAKPIPKIHHSPILRLSHNPYSEFALSVMKVCLFFPFLKFSCVVWSSFLKFILYVLYIFIGTLNISQGFTYQTVQMLLIVERSILSNSSLTEAGLYGFSIRHSSVCCLTTLF